MACKYLYKGQTFDTLQQLNDFMGGEKLQNSSRLALRPATNLKGNAKSLTDQVISAETSRLSNDALKLLGTKFQSAFPNLTFVYTNNDDPNNLTPDQVAYIRNGIVYVNTDKVRVDSMLHEISHVFTYVMKYINPEVYASMVNDVKAFLKENPDIETLMRNNYSLNDEQFYEEMISRVMGWSNTMKVENGLNLMRVSNAEQRSEGIFNSIKNTIQRFFTWVGQALNGLFGINFNIDFQNASIIDIARRLNTAIEGGELVSRISSDQLKTLQDINKALQLNQSVLYQKNLSAKQHMNKIMNTYQVKLFDDMSQDERVEYIIRQILNSPNRKLAAGIIGPAYDFSKMTDTEVRDYVVKNNLASLMNNYVKDVMNKNLYDWCNNGKGALSQVGMMGQDPQGNAIYEDKALSKFKYQIDYDPTFKLMSLEDAQREYPELKFDSYFNDMNVTVVVENSGTTGMTISLYVIDNVPQKHRRIDGVEDKNILDVYNVDNKKADRMKIGLRNDLLSVRNMQLSLLANDIMRGNKKINVRQIGAIGLTPDESHPGFINYYGLRDNIRKMGQVKEFVDDMPDTLKGYFTGEEEFKYLNVGFDNVFETILDNIEGVAGWDYKARNIKNKMKQATLGEKRKWMEIVLSELTKKANPDSGDIYMISTLKDAIKNINKWNIPIDQMNISYDMATYDKLLKSVIHMGEEPIQELQGVVRTTSMKIVDEVNQFKQRFEPIMKWFKDNNYSSYKNDYDDLFVKVSMKDHLGNISDREVGFIYWTDNPNEDKLFGQQARDKGVSKELLEKGRWIVDQVTEQLTDDLMHTMEMNFDMYNPNTKKDYTRDEIRELLFTKHNYQKGMLPIMAKTTTDYLGNGKIGQVIKKKVLQVNDVFTIYDEMVGSEGARLDEMPDTFKDQLLTFKSTKYGSQARLKTLGITEDPNTGQYEIRTPESLKKNQNITHDIETIMNYLMMSSKRKIQYEQHVLPIYNALRLVLNDVQNNKGIKTEQMLQAMDMFVDRAVFGKNKIKELKIGGKDVLPALQTSSAFVGSMVLLGNVNVGVLSTGINGIRAWTQAIANGYKSDKFSPTDLTKASGLFFANIGKIGQLLTDFQLMNMSEYELLSMSKHRVTRKNPLDQQYINFTNWSSDMMARGILLTAQMLHDGTWDAVTYDKESGRTVYDMDKDERYKDMSDGKTKARYKAIKERLIIEGLMSETDDKLTRAYTFEELAAIKYDASVIVGAYDNIDKANASNLLVGRMFLMFRNYLVTAFQDAFHEGKWLDNAGRLKIKEVTGDNGIEYVAEWERIYVEGYVTTLFNSLTQLVRTGKFQKLKEHEKANYRKLIARAAIFLAMYMLYNGLVDKEDDKDDDDNPIPDWRLIKNFRYIAGSIFILPQVIEAVKQPSAFINMVTRVPEKLLKTKNIENIKANTFIPSSVTSLTEPFEEEE